MRPLLLALVLALCLWPLAPARSSGSGDAGLGHDASDDPAAPSALPGFGTYAGQLDEVDQDWYSVTNATAASGAFCFEADASGSGADELLTLGARGAGFDHRVFTPVSTDATAPARLVLAADRASLAYVGLSHVESTHESYTFTIAGSTGTPTNASLVPTPEGALATVTSAMPLPGPCTSGVLDPLAGAGHTTDAYSFAGQAGQQVVYSLGSDVPTTMAQLVDANGTAVGPAIASNGIANVTLPQSGTYYLLASQASSTTTVGYVLGVVGLGKYPCDPYCGVS
jgi:hypothetical protein